MTWLMEIIKTEPEEQLLTKYFVIKHLILLKIRNMMDIKGVLLECFKKFLMQKLLVAVLKMRICQTSD